MTLGLLILTTAFDGMVYLLKLFEVGGSLGALVSMALPETISLILWLVYFIIFLCWMYRVMWNAKRVDPENSKISPGYGVGSYFIPILNFWVPCLGLMQASRSTIRDSKLVLAWWLSSIAVLIIVVVLAFFSGAESEITEDMLNGVDSVNQLMWIDHFIMITDPAIAFLEVVMILPLTRRQREWALGRVASPA